MRLFLSSLAIIAISILLFNNTTLLQKFQQHLSIPSIRLGFTKMATTSQSSNDFPGMAAVPESDPSLNATLSTATPRKIHTTFVAVEQSEGVGARVRRSIGNPKLQNFSPFLLCDHFTVAPPAGFPDHPHRGMETITYLLSGAVDHEDFAGNKGTIWPGDLQFMTSGRGIVHSEMIHLDEDPATGKMKPAVGLQLWVDLPQKLKGCEPRYRDLRASEIPSVTADDGKVEIKIISGQSHGVDSVKELAYTPVWFLDVTIKPGGKLTQNLPAGWNTFAYTLNGNTKFGAGDDAKTVEKYTNVIFEQSGDAVVAEVAEDATESSQFIIVAGTPHNHQVVQYGPFVVNSREEIQQAILDYQTNTNGFERALNWQSEIGQRAY